MPISRISRKLLRELCTNSRVTVTELSKKLNVSRPIISKHIDSLERELGLRYMLELNLKALGFNNVRLIHIKFTKMPSDAEIHKLIDGSTIPIIVMKTEGDFDLAIFAVCGDSAEQGRWEFNLQLELSRYGVRAVASDVDIVHHGFIPVDNEIIRAAGISPVYKKLIIELNQNSRVHIKELSSRLRMNEDMVSYYMKKLLDSGIIKRFTAVVTRPQLGCGVLFFSTYTFSYGVVDRIARKRNTVYFDMGDERNPINEYQMVASLSGGEQDFVWGVYNTRDDAVEQSIDIHKRIFERDRPVIKYGFVKDVMKGHMPIRNIDIKRSYSTI